MGSPAVVTSEHGVAPPYAEQHCICWYLFYIYSRIQNAAVFYKNYIY